MTYKGTYDENAEYSIGDVAVLDGVAYELFEVAQPVRFRTTPTNGGGSSSRCRTW